MADNAGPSADTSAKEGKKEREKEGKEEDKKEEGTTAKGQTTQEDQGTGEEKSTAAGKCEGEEEVKVKKGEVFAQHDMHILYAYKTQKDLDL